MCSAFWACFVPQVIEEDAKIGDIHANSERFDTKSELSFKYLQVGGWVGRWVDAHTRFTVLLVQPILFRYFH